jgi:hypothetical protein
VITGSTGGLGGLPPEALDFEGRRWARLFEGGFAEAKKIMDRLDAVNIRNRMSLPASLPSELVLVEVMTHSLAQARELLKT